ncbi:MULTISPECIES: nicotinate-nucleotide--dimethylbenzimidazole phosphoribosyltransferase [Halomonadaceae]|uniref:nicotinate-nucleotide--dimethylbenzimidazole phosphoribosyltransferase n=1 Tax=Halomonadaceae TaxID=28256 RepID=UPI00159AA240|nr:MULTISPECIES: nicotinate-nucleotide--dimethylbenzimidazole phosphoribosyltransferase [Halomonas]QJQ97043.1 nicotinate-nucleotide--dimethylbenzimidazole phosphoribosyltransferase [Halomonas sp. PA5]
MNATLATLAGPDREAGKRVAAYLDTLTKPPGSLGRLESLAVELAHITGQDFPKVAPPGVLVFAADHGVAAEGVSAFPQEVTAQMVANFVAGGAAINAFARQIGARLEVVDVGVASQLEGDGLVHDKVRPGTANIVCEDAMSREQAVCAIEVGIRAANRALEAGCRCLIVGEMGIANTTASSALLAVLSGSPLDELVGPGTGIEAERLVHKRSVIERAIEGRRADAEDPLEVLTKLGGLEIAAMTGAYLGAAARRTPVLVDGFIATVAALVACRLRPEARRAMIFGHRSREPGHEVALALLEGEPLLDLELRLGEGTGAALAYPILQAATRMLSEMATFASAGVGRDAPSP